ncbi:hypothetical protein BHYA_0079g00170 [Botrytis hyacinthi]|uniref:Uncharacterized protein n=1 Tax=Botrytis hyacinthi TaxID=278943 RepID=A0A4Z1GY16_9HELO|nr:hypothetical protein BHYA_0079g00170 [Botrytis hyacinthi]
MYRIYKSDWILTHQVTSLARAKDFTSMKFHKAFFHTFSLLIALAEKENLEESIKSFEDSLMLCYASIEPFKD